MGKVLASFNGVDVLFDVKYGLDGELRLSFSEVPLVSDVVLYVCYSKELYELEERVVEFISDRLKFLLDRALKERGEGKLVLFADEPFVAKVFGKWTKALKDLEQEINGLRKEGSVLTPILQRVLKERDDELVRFLYRSLCLKKEYLWSRDDLIVFGKMFLFVRRRKELLTEYGKVMAGIDEKRGIKNSGLLKC